MKSLTVCLLILGSILELSAREVAEDNPIDPQGQKWLDSLFTLPEEPRIRKEYRLLTDEERAKYHYAFIRLRNDKSVYPDKYTLLSSLHSRRSTRNSAHRGPGFCGWHRIFMLLAENALRQIYPDITLPYWDVTLESELDLPRESALFTEKFMGNGDGFVINGPFANWTVQRGLLYRTVGARFSPMDNHNISVIFSQKYLADISYPYADRRDENLTNYELVHNRVHNWVGGEMDVIETAADDPIFFIYHCFIDYVFERFRIHQREQGIDPVTDWSYYYGAARHHIYSPMGLGSLMAGDGNSEIFARNIIYQDKPSCSRENPDCGTPYLWCNVTRERCTPWTKKEFMDMEYVAKENGKSLIDEIKVHVEYKIEQEMEKIEMELDELPDDSEEADGNSADSRHEQLLGDKATETALVSIEIAMIVLAACLGLYGAFLITIKCFIHNRNNDNKNSTSYNLNGVNNSAYEPNKIIPDNDIIAEITGGDMVKEVSGKEYNLQTVSHLEKKPSKIIRFQESVDQINEERYVSTTHKSNAEVPSIAEKTKDASEFDENEFPLYENAVFVSENRNLKNDDPDAADKTGKGADSADSRDAEYDNIKAENSHNPSPDNDNTSLSSEIFTSLGDGFVIEERL